MMRTRLRGRPLGSPSLRWLLLGSTLLVVACIPRSQTRLLEVEAPPGELYDCVLYEAASRGFTIVDADRASHFVQVHRVDRDWLGEPHTLEIYATIIPSVDGTGRFLQLASNGRANEEAAGIAVACTSTSPGGGAR